MIQGLRIYRSAGPKGVLNPDPGFSRMFSMNIRYIILALLVAALVGCSRNKKQVVSKYFIDSLIAHYQEPAFSRTNDSVLLFWKKRIQPDLPGIVSEMKYAGALSLRFHLYGDIQDIRMADSTIRKLDADFNHREAAAELFLMRNAILQHRFTEAATWLEKARNNGLKKYDALTASFDVDFELGNYFNAARSLQELKQNDYGYHFRCSKMDHVNGLLDSSILSMERAALSEEISPYLQQVALSNEGDLFIHAGNVEKAAMLYTQCLQMNAADFHSLSGLGWISLMQDHNDTLAEKIFTFIREKNKLPDALYKLYLLAEFRGDTLLEKKYAAAFVHRATDGMYGNMYNKYLIEIYTGILNYQTRAEYLAKNELENRATPQTRAWYAWTLFSNNKKDSALVYFQKNVAGRPLEGLELYWMGKLLRGMNKGYDANAYLKAAYTNKFDLGPGIRHDIEILLNE